jgi:hypothetical protein
VPANLNPHLQRKLHMNINDAFPSKYLSAADIGDSKPTVIIAGFEMIDLETDDGMESKPFLTFKGAKKGMILNKTNANAIQDLYGFDTDAWIGKAIKLIVTRVDYQGRRVPALRIDPPDRTTAAPGMREQAPPAPPKMAAQVPPGHPAAFDDEVPF